MIVYDLECLSCQHRFEGWFKSSDDFTQQWERGFVTCPHCDSANVGKAVQAPRVGRKGNQMSTAARKRQRDETPGEPTAPVANMPLPPAAVEMIHKLARMQADALKSSRYVGTDFAEDARAMHYGERDAETIHGQTTLAEAQELAEEGIAVVPLPFPVVPPEQAN